MSLTLPVDYVDPETGEILPDYYAGQKTILIDELPNVARTIRTLRAEEHELTNYMRQQLTRLDQEKQRIEALVMSRTDRIEERVTFFLGIAERLMTETGKNKVHYPGLGTFRTIKGRASVDTTKYDGASKEERQRWQETNPNLFRTTVRVEPSKTIIKESIEAGETVPDCFILVPALEHFGFVEE